MAGGEGTRLRPLTSNHAQADAAAGQPADDGAHRRPAARPRHRRDRRDRWPSCPTSSATTSATAASSACEMVYATEEQPLGTAGSVRNAMDVLDERFLVISGDVLTDIDLEQDRRLPRGERGAGHHRAGRRREPARVRHRHHPATTARSSGSSRSPRGARCSATPSTPASSCSSRRSSTTSRPTARSTSPSEVFPKLLADGQPLFGCRGRGLLGGRRHPRRLRPGPQGRPRRQGRGRHPRLPPRRGRVARRGRRGPPRRRRRWARR